MPQYFILFGRSPGVMADRSPPACLPRAIATLFHGYALDVRPPWPSRWCQRLLGPPIPLTHWGGAPWTEKGGRPQARNNLNVTDSVDSI